MDDFDSLDGFLAPPDMSLVFNTLRDMGFVLIPNAPTVIYDRRYERSSHYVENLRATSVAGKLGLRSVDTVRRRYLSSDGTDDDHEIRATARDVYVESYLFAARHMAQAKEALQPAPSAEPTFGIFAGSVAMERLEYSMLAAHTLYQLSLRYEGDAVARHMLEQIAWSVAVAPLDDESYVSRIEAQSQISHLTRLTSNPHPGKLYGALGA